MADGGVVVMKLGNAGGAKAPCSDANVQSRKSPGIGASLPTPLDSVRTLQSRLRAKAKSEAAYRFYSLWDKVCREDVLPEAYRRCRANRGAPGADGETFAHIEDHGLGPWLQRLRQELGTKQYRCAPLLRVWIPKANGGQRPLGIPTIRDRVAQMAVLLVLGPIFDEDLFPWQYGFREGMDAKMALRRIHFGIADRGAREVVDADLADYFNTIPHGDLLRCVARRVADGTVLAVIRQWLDAPVVERVDGGGEIRTTTARDANRGTPQGCHLAAAGQPVLPPFHAGVVPRWPRTATAGRGGQLRRRLRDPVPRGHGRRSDGDDAATDVQARPDGQREEDPTGHAARGTIRLPGIHRGVVLWVPRPALLGHGTVDEVHQTRKGAHTRRDDNAVARHDTVEEG